MKQCFGGIYQGKRVLVTGHSGFKGSWLSLWLESLGAKVLGYSLRPPTNPSHFDVLKIGMDSVWGDIRDRELLEKTVLNFKPDIVFHLAAQALVRLSYAEPVNTFETNIMGAVNLYEACRKLKSLQAIVSITTDKVYENKEWHWGYRENDELGGKDPYSASKGAMEIVTKSYRHSYFNLEKYGKEHNTLLAVTRAGNVIGGGDWAQDRLIPDIVKASVKNDAVRIRNPYSTRPWEHVLEPLSGYLLLGQRLLEKKLEFADAFNFGPSLSEDQNVETVVKKLKDHWSKIDYILERPKEQLHEAGLLKLDCTKAQQFLSWKPVWDVETTLLMTAEWYKAFYEKNEIISKRDLQKYVDDAAKLNLIWTKS